MDNLSFARTLSKLMFHTRHKQLASTHHHTDLLNTKVMVLAGLGGGPGGGDGGSLFDMSFGICVSVSILKFGF